MGSFLPSTFISMSVWIMLISISVSGNLCRVQNIFFIFLVVISEGTKGTFKYSEIERQHFIYKHNKHLNWLSKL